MTDGTITEPETHHAPVADGFLPAYRFIEFCSVASHVGKSMLSDYTAQLLAQFGMPVKHVRIESKAARSRHADVVHIDTENFAAAPASRARKRPFFGPSSISSKRQPRTPRGP
jgi:hypothetical protein